MVGGGGAYGMQGGDNKYVEQMVLENQKEETSWKCRHSWGDNVKYILNE
jgi:hypothetical protein